MFNLLKEKIENLPEEKRAAYNLAEIKRAFDFAEKAHRGQKRKSQDDYIIHPLSTALKIIDFGLLDNASIMAALLHDVPEDTQYSLNDIEKNFNKEIRFLVEGITKLGQIKYRGREERKLNIRNMIIAMAGDVRVILIKLADRYHNMETLDYLPPEKQKRVALETLEIYAPLAYRLGMGRVAGNLEDLAFPYVYPEEFNWLIKNLKERRKPLTKYLEGVIPLIKKRLEENEIYPLKIYYRVKHYYSLYKKLLNYDLNFERVYDIVALRIILQNKEECYQTLGIIHKYWPPLPGKIKDYIALPKPNGYQGLHTTVFCENKKKVEFQILTEEMYQKNEFGIACHWYYKEVARKKVKGKTIPPEEELRLFNQLREWKETFLKSPKKETGKLIESFKIDLLKDRIFVLTPKGEAIDLPKGATPVDFAYAIHTEIGDHCFAAKVDGKLVPLSYQLHSGEVVEIITQKKKKPSKSWLKFVKTSLAKRRIKNLLLKEKI